MNDLEFPSYDPVYPIRKKVQPKQKRTRAPSSWGNEQVKTVGQNQTAPEWEVKWILYDEDANIIDAFLEERAKYNQSFLWSPPNYPQNRYRCDSWSKSLVDAFVSEVNATFKRIYDYDNLISVKLLNAGYGIATRTISFGFGRFIAAEASYLSVSGSADFGRIYQLSLDTNVITIAAANADFAKGLASSYFSGMDQQVYGWDRDFQVDWWGD